MHIQIKHNELIQAITAYMATKGLHLDGKHVEYSFTTTRKPKQTITVDIEIIDAVIPGFTDEDPVQEKKPVDTTMNLLEEVENQERAVAQEAQEVQQEPQQAQAEPAQAPQEEATSTSSIFSFN